MTDTEGQRAIEAAGRAWDQSQELGTYEDCACMVIKTYLDVLSPEWRLVPIIIDDTDFLEGKAVPARFNWLKVSVLTESPAPPGLEPDDDPS